MSDKDFDKIIGDKLRDYQERPPRDMFSRIENTLGDASSPLVVPARRRGLMVRISSYLASAAVIAVAVLLLVRQDAGTDKLPDAVAIEDIVDTLQPAEVDATRLIKDNEERIASVQSTDSPAKNLTEVIMKVAAQDNLALNTAVGESPVMSDAVLAEVTELYESPAENLEENYRRPRSGRGLADESLESAHRRRKAEREQSIEDYWANMFTDDDFPISRNRRPRGSAALYAGNFGTGSGDISYNDKTVLAKNNMLIKEASITVPGPMEVDMQDAPQKMPINRDRLGNYTLKHRMPLNVGISLTYPISERLFIVSGINYSYLNSVSKQPVSYNGSVNGTLTQELHYLGIPVGVMYSLYGTGRWDFYVRGGGTLEKALYAVQKVEYRTSNTTSEDTSQLGVKGIQVSLDAAAGVSLMLSRSIGIYIEPGVAYYFEGMDQPASYRSDNPTNFTLRAGIRFSFR